VEHSCAGPDVVKILVGNKCDDKKRVAVPRASALALADKLVIDFIETSAKDGTRVDDAFAAAVRTLLLAWSTGA
jgi:GTPase SAR1 family protein